MIKAGIPIPEDVCVKYIFGFRDAEALNIDLVGYKYASLARASREGLAVPQAMVVITEAHRFYRDHRTWPPGLIEEVLGIFCVIPVTVNCRLFPKNNILPIGFSSAKYFFAAVSDKIIELGSDKAVLAFPISILNVKNVKKFESTKSR